MNVKHIRAVNIAGLQYWLGDKKSIIMRLILWPNLIPLFLIAFIGLALGVMLLRSAPGGDISSIGGLTYSVYGDTNYSKQIDSALSEKKERFELIYLADNSQKGIREAIKSKEITFALNVTINKDKGDLNFDIVYDRSRDYVHKEWIKVVKNSGSDIALSIRKERFSTSEHSFDDAVINYNLAPFRIKEAAYGKSSGAMVSAFIVLMLWSILLVTPLDAAASITSSQMISDTSEDFISIWKAAGVNSGDIVLGRFITSLSVFVLALVAFYTYITLWVTLYIYVTDIFVSVVDKNNLNNETIYILTTGFKDLIQSLAIGDLFALFAFLMSSGSVILMLRMRLSVYISDLEQARTRFKPFEIILFNMPIIGFVAGSFTLSPVIMCVPILNQLVAMQYFFKGGISFTLLIIGIASNLLVSYVLYLSTQSHIGKQKRLMCY